MSDLRNLRGTHDLYGQDILRHRFILEKAETTFEKFGFQEIATPILEYTNVFQKTLGDTSDIINKEMYIFEDRGGDSVTLRPEGTASIARAFISNGLSRNLPLKFYYHGPMFRYERPQKGRQRQFHQIGVELLGVENSFSDVEVISMAHMFLNCLETNEKITLEINSIGDSESRGNFRAALVEYLNQHVKGLSTESQRRLTSNPLRILDSKDEKDIKIIKTAPVITEYLNDSSKAIWDEVQSLLTDVNISYTHNPYLVRGLDYYCHCIFEFKASGLGAQNTVLAGGRFDQLISQMGGPDTVGVGWACGIERLALIIDKELEYPRPIVLVPIGEKSEAYLKKLSFELRQKGFVIDMAYSGNLSKRMKKANAKKARLAIICGDDELDKDEATIKNFDSGEQNIVKLSQITESLSKL